MPNANRSKLLRRVAVVSRPVQNRHSIARLPSLQPHQPPEPLWPSMSEAAIGPRLGVVFDLLGTGKSVVRAFWGRYYEAPSTNTFVSAAGGYEDPPETVIVPRSSTMPSASRRRENRPTT